MRRVSAPIFAALILAACDEHPSFDRYVLALSWEPAFCELNYGKPECGALDSGDFAAWHLSIHGLWPNSGPDEGPSYCGVGGSTQEMDRPKSWCSLPEPRLSAETQKALGRTMPGVQSCLERHEWIKHGTCAGIDAEPYFASALRLAAAIEATPLGKTIAGNVGRDLPRGRLIGAFETTFGAGTGKALALICSSRGGKPYLTEIRIALKPSALEGDLDGADLYLDGPGPAGRCPETVHIDSIRD